jgi:hypothetical protein
MPKTSAERPLLRVPAEKDEGGKSNGHDEATIEVPEGAERQQSTQHEGDPRVAPALPHRKQEQARGGEEKTHGHVLKVLTTQVRRCVRDHDKPQACRERETRTEVPEAKPDHTDGRRGLERGE